MRRPPAVRAVGQHQDSDLKLRDSTIQAEGRVDRRRLAQPPVRRTAAVASFDQLWSTRPDTPTFHKIEDVCLMGQGRYRCAAQEDGDIVPAQPVSPPSTVNTCPVT